LAAIRVLAFSGRSAAADAIAAVIAVADVRIVVAVPTAEGDAPTAVVAPSLAAHVSNAVPAVQAAQDTTAVIRAGVTALLVVRSSFPKC